MKNSNLIFVRKTLFAIALFGATIAPSAMLSAHAAPNPNPSRDGGSQYDRRDSSQNDRNRDGYMRDQNNAYEAVRTYTGTVLSINSDREFHARVDGRTYKIYADSSTRGLRVGQTVSIRGQMYRGTDIRNASVSAFYDRNDNRSDYWRDRNGKEYYDPSGKLRDIERNQNNTWGRDNTWGRNDNRNNNYRNLEGVVTRVRNNREFDIRANGTTYNVYANLAIRSLHEGDWVRVSGRNERGNDIRDANVTITRDRDYNSNRRYNGVVTWVRNDHEFEVRSDGRTYRVYTSSRTRGLNRGDEVRIDGRRSGDTIRDADVIITRNR